MRATAVTKVADGPLMVVENGLGACDTKSGDGKGMIHNDYRIDYMRQHMAQREKRLGTALAWDIRPGAVSALFSFPPVKWQNVMG